MSAEELPWFLRFWLTHCFPSIVRNAARRKVTRPMQANDRTVMVPKRGLV